MAYLLVFLILFLSPVLALAQPVVGTVASYSSAGIPLLNHTTANLTLLGTNRVLALIIASEEAGVDATPTSATFAGTQAFQLVTSSGDGDQPASPWHISLWVLTAPTITVSTVTYTFAAPVTSSAIIIPITNARQGIPTLSDTDVCDPCVPPGTVTGNLTTVVDNTLLLAGTLSNQDPHTHTPGAGQTELLELSIPEPDQWTVSASTKVVSPAGADSMSTTADDGIFPNDYIRFFAVGFEPFVAPAAVRRRSSVRIY